MALIYTWVVFMVGYNLGHLQGFREAIDESDPLSNIGIFLREVTMQNWFHQHRVEAPPQNGPPPVADHHRYQSHATALIGAALGGAIAPHASRAFGTRR